MITIEAHDFKPVSNVQTKVNVSDDRAVLCSSSELNNTIFDITEADEYDIEVGDMEVLFKLTFGSSAVHSKMYENFIFSGK